MKLLFNSDRSLGEISPMIYGHFIEHFHRQIYGGVYDPGNPLSDEEGLRTDVLDAMRRIKVPILRWPGGCFVSSYHWKDAVGKQRRPFFDKAWRVEDPNTFGTDEYVDMCRKIGCAPYICTNAGTGTAEEMSDWLEYCNLENEGMYAKWRIENGHEAPHNVKYWSIGNENYGKWEIGAKSSQEWGRLVLEAAKMMKHVDPTAELSAAALSDVEWNVGLLTMAGEFLDWISVHAYWDALHQVNNYADYEACMAYTGQIPNTVDRVRGLLTAMGLEGKIKIAFDEWNLRGWHHPNAHTVYQGITKEEYLLPRDENDDNTRYTMADAVFAACFLNMCARNCDIVGMANFAPIVNTRGCIFTHQDGIVLRSTYHVFDLYVNYLGSSLLDSWTEGQETMQVRAKTGDLKEVPAADILPTWRAEDNTVAIAVVNKSADKELTVCLQDVAPLLRSAQRGGQAQEKAASSDAELEYRIITVNGDSTESYNDKGHEGVTLQEGSWQAVTDGLYTVDAHSVNVIQIRRRT